MAGMMRFKDEKDFEALLKRTHLKLAKPIAGRTQPSLGAVVRVDKITTAGPMPAEPKEKVGSEIEELFAQQIRLVGNLPEPQREYCHLRGSKHRLDFAWPEYRVNGMQLGVEVQGMVHRVKHNFSNDLEKRARGLLQNWMVLEVGGEQIRSGKAMEWLQELFKRAKKDET